jgi:hypothetical protein
MRTIKKTCTKCAIPITFKVASKEQIKSSLESLGWISRPGLTLCVYCKNDAEYDKRRKEEKEWKAFGQHEQFGQMWYCPKYKSMDYPQNGKCAFCKRLLTPSAKASYLSPD